MSEVAGLQIRLNKLRESIEKVGEQATNGATPRLREINGIQLSVLKGEEKWVVKELAKLGVVEAPAASAAATAPAEPVGLEFPEFTVPGANDPTLDPFDIGGELPGPTDAAVPPPAKSGSGLTIDDVGDPSAPPDDQAPPPDLPGTKAFEPEPVFGAADRPRTQERPGTGTKDPVPERPRTQERPGTGVKDPIPETRSPALVLGAAGLVAAVLAIGVWQAVAGSPQTASLATIAPVPTTTSRPATTAAPATAAPTAAAGTVRVTGQPATYSGACGGWSVTFVWILEGVQSGNFLMHTATGSGPYGPDSGPFTLSNTGSLTWDPATGRLTIRGAGSSGASQGYRSQIVKVNGRDITGDATSIAAPGYCS